MELKITPMQRNLITLCVMMVAIVEVLDMTIVNVALPTMMGQLGANVDQITWVLTSYIVAAAIVMPLTGLLVERMGRKRLLLINIAGFMIASALCGLSQSLDQIVFFRILQGIFGASLVPLSQYILRETYPIEQHGRAMAIWGIGIMMGPILGPTLGGYITETMSWRWVFYINVPVCILAWFLAISVITETKTKKLPIDWIGLFLLVVGIGALQVFLDRGNTSDWFQSHLIVVLAWMAILGLTAFLLRGWHKKDNIINLQIFKNRNFILCSIIIATYFLGMLGSMTLIPIMVEHLFNYSTMQAGLLMAPRGIASAITMIVTARLMRHYDSRIITGIGIVFVSIGTYLMSGLNLSASQDSMLPYLIIQGIGDGMFFVPIATLAFVTLKQKEVPEAAGLFSFSRSIGGSIGISILSTVLTRQSQANWHELGAHLKASNAALHKWLVVKHLSINSPLAWQELGQLVSNHSSMLAYNDAYWLSGLAYIAVVPLLFFIKSPSFAELKAQNTL